jgi:hypothetical protein
VRDRAVRDDPADDRRVRRTAGDPSAGSWARCPGPAGRTCYLREAFQHRTGRLLPFLFVWTAMFTIPLIMSTGVIGLIQYLGWARAEGEWPFAPAPRASSPRSRRSPRLSAAAASRR